MVGGGARVVSSAAWTRFAPDGGNSCLDLELCDPHTAVPLFAACSIENGSGIIANSLPISDHRAITTDFFSAPSAVRDDESASPWDPVPTHSLAWKTATQEQRRVYTALVYDPAQRLLGALRQGGVGASGGGCEAAIVLRQVQVIIATAEDDAAISRRSGGGQRRSAAAPLFYDDVECVAAYARVATAQATVEVA